MKTKILTIFFFVSACIFTSFAADKLAIAEPVGKGGVKAEEIETLWGILETAVQSDEYKLISRAALKQMLTEIGLTNSSGLVNLNSSQKAKMGQLETVKYILVTEVGKFGSRYNCTLKIIDSSTGEIDQTRTYNLRVSNFDDIADQIESVMEKLLSDDKNQKICAIITPIIKDRRAAREIGSVFNSRMEEYLLKSGVRLRALQSISKILKKNKLDALYELEPAKYKTVGKLLDSKYLIQVVLDRCSVTTVNKGYNKLLKKNISYQEGNISGFVKILYGDKSEICHVTTFNGKIDFSDLDIDTDDWTKNDYEIYLVNSVIPSVCKDFISKIK